MQLINTCSSSHLMVRYLYLFYLGLVIICLTSAIITCVLEKLHVGGGLFLHAENIFEMFFFISYVTVALLR